MLDTQQPFFQIKLFAYLLRGVLSHLYQTTHLFEKNYLSKCRKICE